MGLSLAGLALLLGTDCRPHQREQDRDHDKTAAAAPVKIIYPAAPGSFVKMASKAAKALAHVRTDQPVRGGPAEWFPADTARPSPADSTWTTRIQRALGSAFVVDRLGHLLTNAHIVGKDRKIWVTLADGKELPATIVGRDPRTDLAVLKITPPLNYQLDVARLGDSDQLQTGEWVVALSNPFGLGYRLNAGVVSAAPRRNAPIDAQGYWSKIQTDIEVNAGNSGGPLLNTLGEVVGLTTAVRANARGVGLALPINTIKKLLPTLKREGKIVRAWVGMYIASLGDAQAKALGLKNNKGALVSGIVTGSPAERAGLRKGDVITRFDGRPITQASQLPWLSAVIGVNRLVPVMVWRDGKAQKFSLRTARMPE